MVGWLCQCLAQALDLTQEQRPERYGDFADQHGHSKRKPLDRVRLEDSRMHKPTRQRGRAAGLRHSFVNQMAGLSTYCVGFRSIREKKGLKSPACLLVFPNRTRKGSFLIPLLPLILPTRQNKCGGRIPPSPKRKRARLGSYPRPGGDGLISYENAKSRRSYDLLLNYSPCGCLTGFFSRFDTKLFVQPHILLRFLAIART
jgi:hypothetical protein